MWAYGAKGIIDLAQQNFVSKKTPIDSLLEPWTLDLGNWFDNQPEGHVERAVLSLQEDTVKTRELFNSFDFILSPVTQTVAPRIGSMAPDIDFDTLLERSLNFITFTPLPMLLETQQFHCPYTGHHQVCRLELTFMQTSGMKRNYWGSHWSLN